VSSSVQRPRAERYRSGVSRKSIVGTPASVHGSKAVGVACLESMNWERVKGAGQVYLSHIGGCAHDHVIWSATLLRRRVRHGIIVDAYRTSNNRVRGALWKAMYVQDGPSVRSPKPLTSSVSTVYSLTHQGSDIATPRCALPQTHDSTSANWLYIPNHSLTRPKVTHVDCSSFHCHQNIVPEIHSTR
jgi:hypothetical protein